MPRTSPPSRTARSDSSADRDLAVSHQVEALARELAAEGTTRAVPPRVLLVGDRIGGRQAAGALADELQRPIEPLDLQRLCEGTLEEAERSLDAHLASAAERRAVLYVAEADALFGRRAAGEDSDDHGLPLLRHALDHYAGVVALAVEERPADELIEAGRFAAVVELPRRTQASGAAAGPAADGGPRPRNFKLIRALLQDAERDVPLTRLGSFTYSGTNASEVAYHVELLVEAGLLRGRVARSRNGGISAEIESLTWQGHDVLALMLDDQRWQSVQPYLDESGRADMVSLLERLRAAR